MEIRNWKLENLKYSASSGVEYFIQAVGKGRDKNALYGFCRLRLPAAEKELNSNALELSSFSAMIRELHVYGELVPVGSKKKVQHAGLGRMLMAEAEKITRKNGYNKISVIAGVGVREYYRKLGYRLKQTYMEKEL